MSENLTKSSFDELMVMMQSQKHRKRPSEEEHRLQCACVRWFALEYPEHRGRLFAVPNGGKRNAITAAKLKEEGVIAGVADLILLLANKDYGALLIEMKTPTGRQSAAQKSWQKAVCAAGEYQYAVCRSLDDFISTINEYLKNLNNHGTTKTKQC